MSEDNRVPEDYPTSELLDILGVDCDWAAEEVRERIAALVSALKHVLSAISDQWRPNDCVRCSDALAVLAAEEKRSAK